MSDEKELTGSNTHRANQPGYASGVLLQSGDFVPAGIPVSDNWMDEVDGSSKLQRAVNEALDPQPGDVDLNQLSKAALEARAADEGGTDHRDQGRLRQRPDPVITGVAGGFGSPPAIHAQLAISHPPPRSAQAPAPANGPAASG